MKILFIYFSLRRTRKRVTNEIYKIPKSFMKFIDMCCVYKKLYVNNTDAISYCKYSSLICVSASRSTIFLFQAI